MAYAAAGIVVTLGFLPGVDAPGVVFYIGSVTIVVTLLPRNDASVKSPYVAVIELLGPPAPAPSWTLWS